MRPKRLYYDQDKDKYFYLINSKKKYIKKPKNMSQRQLVKINIKNIIGDTRPKKVKRRKYKKTIKLQKQIVPELSKAIINEVGLPVYLFRENKRFGTLDDFVKNKDKDDVKLLTDQFKVPTLVNNYAKPPIIEDISSLASSFIETKPATPRGKKTLLEIKDRTIEIVEKAKEIRERTPVPTPETTPLREDEDEEDEPKKYVGLPEKILMVNLPNQLSSLLGRRITKEEQKSYKNSDVSRFAIVREIKQKNRDFPDIPVGNFKNWSQEIKNQYDIALRFEGKGNSKGNSKDGLYNDEISKILKANIKDYIPVIASNEINDMIRYVKPDLKRFGFIINTSDSSSDGSGNDGKPVGHWRACYINNEDDYQSIEIFDPLVNEPENGLVQGLREIAKKMNPETLFKFKINYLQRQNKNTGTCGYHAIKFLDDRFNGVPFSVASGYDDYIEKHAPDHSADGEENLKNKIKKYNSFI